MVTVGSCNGSNGDSSGKRGEEKRHLGNNVDRDNSIQTKEKRGKKGNNQGSCKMKKRNLGHDVMS